MTTLQFSLFFVALLVAYVLVHVRLVRFEEHLREIAGLKMLNERLKGVSDVLERVRLDHVEELLEKLVEGVDGLRKETTRIDRQIARTAVAASVERAAPVHSETGHGERILALVESRLFSLGYRDLRVLTDLSDVHVEDEIEVRVECTREGMPTKGRVITKNGAVQDVVLQNAAQTFT